MILLPLGAGLGLLFVKSDWVRRVIVATVAAVLGVCSVLLAGWHYPNALTAFPIEAHTVGRLMMAVEVGMGGYVLWVGWTAKRPVIFLLMLAQLGLMLAFEWREGAHLQAAKDLFVDKFSIIMALLIGIVGSLTCVYALGYMRAFHEQHHPEIQDRRPLFFGLLFVFLGAMFGIVFSNNLIWLYFFWEITTLCSFLLIGYKQNEESKNNALRALAMNLVGGLAMAAGIVWFFHFNHSIELDRLVRSPGGAALVPAALFAIAGLTKSAQFPFARWLLGAMVAPTPVSALLHSSTMVKAGVYLVIRLAPVLSGTLAGNVVAMIGAVTFLVASFEAIGTSDAKKVLAYSTIANLGLIVLCAGVGTYAAVWAGVLLIVFHAVAKGLLFLCVGEVEHKLHSRDIEAMSGLVLSLPRLSVMLQIGMAGMFLAPFGMLISKWAVLKAVVDAFPLLSIFVAFGGAATLFFWVKWMGKLIEVVKANPVKEKDISAWEWTALYALSGLTFGTCLFFPFISSSYIEPFVIELYGRTATMAHGNFVIMIIMLAVVSLFPLSFFSYGRKVKVMDPFLSGANAGRHLRFQGAAGTVHDLTMNNYYFVAYLDGKLLSRMGVYLCGSLLGLLLLAAYFA